MTRFRLSPPEIAGLVALLVLLIVFMIWFTIEGLGPIPLLITAATVLVSGILSVMIVRVMFGKGNLPRDPPKH